ncbi:LlaJI family restriction endonuclease [Lactococcus lactis]|uniref:Type II restriction-modification system restriction subunit n=1 Tax=Lactococcus lactis subsp. lactis TaxID=1360 RepID=A0A1V0NFZ9_LACLL|nr:LlaJI family restriction endonuclease [Lactococcus lactis]ARD98856.1 type II restriction-modification system restriction subunit [Lactococcus lactis subsp. lactis]
MKMRSLYLREYQRYSQAELVRKFNVNESETVKILKKLKEYGILKAVKNSDLQKNLSELQDNEIEIADVEVGENEYLYVFTYVGVITLHSMIIKIFPKYIFNDSAPYKELKQVLKVIKKYDSKEQIIRMLNETTDSTAFNLLAVMLYLLNDYHEYGPYTNSEDIIETNGVGDILWDKTINETFTLISKNRPYYPDLQTKKCVNNDFDYFKRLHEAIITKSSKELEQAEFLDLFDILGEDISDEVIEDFGEQAYILERINKELSVQFNTRKQLLLKTMYAYIFNQGILADEDSFSMYGTSSFNLVWEKVCVEVLNNQLNTPPKNLELPINLADKYKDYSSLIEIIEKPNWKNFNESYSKKSDKTLIPDIVSIGNSSDNYQFTILDAKYYNFRFSRERLTGQPGIESITKQYLYQLAFQEFTQEHGISNIKNCFLFPTEEDRMKSKGYVEMQMLANLDLSPIQNRMLPATKMYDFYLRNIKLPISKLCL